VGNGECKIFRRLAGLTGIVLGLTGGSCTSWLPAQWPGHLGAGPDKSDASRGGHHRRPYHRIRSAAAN